MSDTQEAKTCTKCNVTRPIKQFNIYKSANGQTEGRRNVCRYCHSHITPPEQRGAAVVVPSVGTTVVPPPTPQEQIQIARLRVEMSEVKSRLKDMEGMAMSADKLRELIGSLGSPNVQANPEWLRGASEPQSVTGTAVLLLSDIHFDEVVSRAQIGGCNEYDRDIAVQRLQNTFRNAIVLSKGYLNTPRYDGMVCALGGDLLSGNIHDELTETNHATINQSMLALEEILIEGLGTLADEFGKLHVPCVTGNHGRMHHKPRAKNRAFENYEWSIYQRLIRYFRNDPRITFDVPEGPDAMFNVYDRRYCLTHGDQFRGGNGIGGIMVPILRGVSKKQMRQQAIRDPFDVILMGHWHQYSHHASGLVINGSVKGYDEYAFANNFAFEVPQQALFVAHPKHGATFRMPVFCDKTP